MQDISRIGLLQEYQNLNDVPQGLPKGSKFIIINEGYIEYRVDANGNYIINQGGDVSSLITRIDALENKGYKGLWDANTNTPTLINGIGTAGENYQVSIAGSCDFGSGIISFDINDYVIYNGSQWFKNESVVKASEININATLTPDNNIITGGDTLQIVVEKTQGQFNNLSNQYEPKNSNIQTHISDTNNPHSTTKAQVGLGNVDNTSDIDKPISNATQTALNGKEPVFSKNTAFNKNFGTAAGEVAEGNDTRIVNAFQKNTDTLDNISTGTTNIHLTTTLKTQYDTAYSQTHTHTNKTILDNTTASYTTTEQTKLSGIQAGAEVNVQSDWNETNNGLDSYIQNKPNLSIYELNTNKVSAFQLTPDNTHYPSEKLVKDQLDLKIDKADFDINKEDTIWAFQDFTQAQVNSTTITLTTNENATSPIVISDISKIIGNSATIVQVNNESKPAYYNTLLLLTNQVKVNSHITNTIVINNIPNTASFPIRIYFRIKYKVSELPDGRVEAPAFVQQKFIEALNDNYATDKELEDVVATLIVKSNNGNDFSDLQTTINNITQVTSATNEYVLTKDTISGNAIWKQATGGGIWGSIIGTLSNQTDLQNALNTKEPTLTKGNLTESISNVLQITNGTNSVIGSGTQIRVMPAGPITNGFLYSADWNAFNNKVSSQWVTVGSDIVYPSMRAIVRNSNWGFIAMETGSSFESGSFQWFGPDGTRHGFFGRDTNASNSISLRLEGGRTFYIDGSCQINGNLSKNTGSFDIPHPDPIKKDKNYRLRHYFVESPTAGDLIYRFIINIDNDNLTDTITLPDYFKFLNTNVQVFVSPKKHFGIAYGEINEEMTELLITANQKGLYNVLVIGTRNDELAVKEFIKKGVEYRDVVGE